MCGDALCGGPYVCECTRVVACVWEYMYVCLCVFPVLESSCQLVFVLLGDLNAASTKSKVTSVGE